MLKKKTKQNIQPASSAGKHASVKIGVAETLEGFRIALKANSKREICESHASVTKLAISSL